MLKKYIKYNALRNYWFNSAIRLGLKFSRISPIATIGRSICLCIAFSYLGIIGNSAFAQTKTEETYFDIEQKIETIIRTLIGPILPLDNYYLIVKIPENVSQKPSTVKTLPYTTLQTNEMDLKSLLLNNDKNNFLKVPVNIELYFDKGVSEQKQVFIVDKIKKNLLIDDKNRTLKSESTTLVAAVEEPKPKEDPNEALKIQIESEKLKNEKSMVELEHQKFAATKKQSEFEERIKKLQEEQSKIQEKLAAKAAEPPTPAKKELIDYLKEFQLIAVSLIIGVFLILLALLGGSAQKKSLANLSNSVKGIGDGIVQMAAASAAAGNESNEQNAEDNKVVNGGDGPQNGGTENEEQANQAKMEQFLTLVEEKIEILSIEENYNFYRYFLDLMENNITYAAAILVAVKPETSKMLLKNIPAQYSTKIKETLGTEGGFNKIKQLRKPALEAFYGLIAMDEFMDSPLANIKNTGWIASLTSEEMKELVVDMDESERKYFLACMTPTRLSLMLEAANDAKEKNAIINAIKDIDSVTAGDIPKIFEKIKVYYNKLAQQKEVKVKSLLDGPQFISRIISNISPDNRIALIKAISTRSELFEAIKKYYVPFDVILKLEKSVIADIFGKRQASQVALAIFAADETLRNTIIGSLSESIQDTIKEELDYLVTDKDAEENNKKKSYLVQDEICRYLLKLNQSGLLKYASNSPATANAKTATAA